MMAMVFGTLVAIAAGEEPARIGAATVQQWSAQYRGWHYWPDHVIPAKPGIKAFEDVRMTDVPTVYQLPGDDKWYMTFIGFDGTGYQSFVAESDDLLNWGNIRLAMGFGPEGEFDHGGVVLGAFLYDEYGIKSRRTLKKKDGRYWSLYGAYPRQGGYELRPGYEGVACSNDGLTWRRAKDEPILSVHQEDCGVWEKDCIYQPWLVEHEGRYYNFYNAANGSIEQMGLARSDDLLAWKRYEHNPVVPNGPDGSYNQRFSSDGKVFRDREHALKGLGIQGQTNKTRYALDKHQNEQDDKTNAEPPPYPVHTLSRTVRLHRAPFVSEQWVDVGSRPLDNGNNKRSQQQDENHRNHPPEPVLPSKLRELTHKPNHVSKKTHRTSLRLPTPRA